MDFEVEIDENSGFCFGVVNAIAKAEKELEAGKELYCLGDIVHNGAELKRLQDKGLKIINHGDMPSLHGKTVLLRAHGEPPSTYRVAGRNDINIIDATCPVVLRLQGKIRNAYSGHPDRQIVIYGKNGHAEVNGLVGQTESKAIVVENESDLQKIDFSRDVVLFSQTTKPKDGFRKLKEAIAERISPDCSFEAYDTICGQVSGRMEKIAGFAASHDLIIFAGGLKSSNVKALFETCRRVNPNTRFVSSPAEVLPEWLEGVSKVGICGATSTPKWQMEDIRQTILKIKGNN